MAKKVIDLTPDEFTGWLTALRSGTYRHGRGRLTQHEYNICGEVEGTSYCCLGVLQNLFGFDADATEDEMLNMDEDANDVIIAKEYQEIMAEMNDQLGRIEGNWRHTPETYRVSDGRPVFEQVADYIEQHYEPRSRVI